MEKRIDKKDFVILLGFILALFIFRNIMLFFGFSNIATLQPTDLGEALRSLNFAYDLLDFNLFRGERAYIHGVGGHLGNELMTSFFAIPLYFLFGPSILVAFQVPILFSSLILAAIYFVCHQSFSRRVAIIAALLFLCSPGYLQGWLMLPHCVVFEASLWTLGIIYFYLTAGTFASKKEKNYLILCGLISGIGFFHNVVVLASILALFFVWIVYDRSRFLVKHLSLYATGFLIGALPVFYLDNGSLFKFLISLFLGNYSGTHNSVTGEYFLENVDIINMAFWPTYQLLGNVLHVEALFLLNIFILILTVILLKKNKKLNKTHLFFLVLIISYSCAGIINKAGAMRYYHPLYVPLFIWFAVFFEELIEKSRYIIFRLLIILSVIYLCVISIRDISIHFDSSQVKAHYTAFERGRGFNDYRLYVSPFPIKNWTENAKEVWEQLEDKDIMQFGAGAYLDNQAYFDQPKVKELWKIIRFTPASRYALMQMNSREDYLLYGIDVAYLGLDLLVQDINERVRSDYLEYVYRGLAVFYMNEYWMRDILSDFKSGKIDQLIPFSYQKYFYDELARKLVDRYDEVKQIKKKIQGLSLEKIEEAFNRNFPEKGFSFETK